MRLLLCCMSVLAFYQQTLSPEVRRLVPDAPGYIRILERYNDWIAAAQARDIDALSEFTWPEYTPAVQEELRKSGSTLYRDMVADYAPLQRLLKKEGAQVVVFEELQEGQPKYFAACLAQKPEIAWPRTFLEITSLKRSDVFCTYWVSEKEGLFISYAYGVPE